MMKNTRLRSQRAVQGQSLIELALLLPPMLILVFGVIDYARAIQFNNILVAMSREGANLAARTSMSHQVIIKALNDTAEPLLMAARGRVYITQIIGRKVDSDCDDAPPTYCATYPKVEAQTKSLTGNATLDLTLDANLPSKVWTCSSWSGGACNSVPASATDTFTMALSDGEVVYAVETLYDYNVIVNYVMETGPKLYSLTVL